MLFYYGLNHATVNKTIFCEAILKCRLDIWSVWFLASRDDLFMMINLLILFSCCQHIIFKLKFVTLVDCATAAIHMMFHFLSCWQ